MSNKHMPGSWSVHPRGEYADDGPEYYEVRDEQNVVIADYVLTGADAYLLAAAPDLLDCCKLWVAYFDRLTRNDEPGDRLGAERNKFHGSRVEATRAAIAKAEGRL